MRKMIRMMLTSAICVMGLTFSAFAASNLSSVSIRIQETKEEPGVVWQAEPMVNSSSYELESYEWSSDYDSWQPGREITANVVLTSNGTPFSSKTTAYVNNGKSLKVNKSGSKLKVRIEYTPKVTLAVPENLHYEDDYTLSWDKVDYAGGYEVKLYKDGDYFKTIKRDGRNETDIDLSEYATEDYLITAAVRAIAPKGKSSFIISSEWSDDEETGISSSGDSTVYGKFYGSGTSKTFKDMDGNQVSGWQYINGSWYFFDPADQNHARTNAWMLSNNLWYVFDGEGKMITGWAKSGDYWYFMNQGSRSDLPIGAMMTGWIAMGPAGPWYYFNNGSVANLPFGAMLANTTTPDGYAVNANGEWIQ